MAGALPSTQLPRKQPRPAFLWYQLAPAHGYCGAAGAAQAQATATAEAAARGFRDDAQALRHSTAQLSSAAAALALPPPLAASVTQEPEPEPEPALPRTESAAVSRLQTELEAMRKSKAELEASYKMQLQSARTLTAAQVCEPLMRFNDPQLTFARAFVVLIRALRAAGCSRCCRAPGPCSQFFPLQFDGPQLLTTRHTHVVCITHICVAPVNTVQATELSLEASTPTPMASAQLTRAAPQASPSAVDDVQTESESDAEVDVQTDTEAEEEEEEGNETGDVAARDGHQHNVRATAPMAAVGSVAHHQHDVQATAPMAAVGSVAHFHQMSRAGDAIGIAQSLAADASLVNRRDVATGNSALHWAAVCNQPQLGACQPIRSSA
eukprot:COSAG01_NODE_249_length_20357_cov_3.458171_2_plen_381_part_00